MLVADIKLPDKKEYSLAEACLLARNIFEAYAAIHREKGTAEGNAKARFNEDLAKRMNSALTNNPIVPPDFWAAIDEDKGDENYGMHSIEYALSTNDANEGQFARDMVNQHINDIISHHGKVLHLHPLYRRKQ
jgi:hypothetical protein